MKKLLSLTAVFSVVTILLFLALGSTSSAQRQVDPAGPGVVSDQTAPATNVLECYNVDKGDSVNVSARLITKNFGGDLVAIRQLVMMCEESTKNAVNSRDAVPPPLSDTRIYACYSLQRGGDPDDPYVIETKNFGKDGVVVRTSNLMCETASKTVTDAAGNSRTIGTPTGSVMQCFKLSSGDSPNQAFTLVNNNFGASTVKVGTGIQLCEEAQKDRLVDGAVVSSGLANGFVRECFAIRGGDDPKAVVTLETKNFGKDEVVVRRAVTMCEGGEKTPVYIVGVSFPPNSITPVPGLPNIRNP
jgi:hypothetical protein